MASLIVAWLVEARGAGQAFVRGIEPQLSPTASVFCGPPDQRRRCLGHESQCG